MLSPQPVAELDAFLGLSTLLRRFVRLLPHTPDEFAKLSRLDEIVVRLLGQLPANSLALCS